jgi:hypothetical protein
MSSLFQGLCETDGKVRVVSTATPVDGYHRGMAVAGDAILAELYGGSPPAAYIGGVGVSEEGYLIVSTDAKAGSAPGGLAVDANSILLASQVVEVIHQGVGLTTIGELSNNSLGSLTLADPPPPPPDPPDPFVVAGQNEAQLNIDNLWVNGPQIPPAQTLLGGMQWNGSGYDIPPNGVGIQPVGGTGTAVFAYRVVQANGLDNIRLWDGSAYITKSAPVGVSVHLVPFDGAEVRVGNPPGGLPMVVEDIIFVVL